MKRHVRSQVLTVAFTALAILPACLLILLPSMLRDAHHIETMFTVPPHTDQRILGFPRLKEEAHPCHEGCFASALGPGKGKHVSRWTMSADHPLRTTALHSVPASATPHTLVWGDQGLTLFLSLP